MADNHLAVCDETSLVSPDDYIPCDLFMGLGGSIVQYRLAERNAKKHRWYDTSTYATIHTYIG